MILHGKFQYFIAGFVGIWTKGINDLVGHDMKAVRFAPDGIRYVFRGIRIRSVNRIFDL